MAGTDLLPCPFCGGEDLDVHAGVIAGRRHECVTITCNDCVGSIYGGTEERAIEAWNTRAEYHCFEDASVDAWKRIKAYQERTCRNTDDDCDAWFKCSECGLHSKLEIMSGGYDIPNYCPNCGAKVVGE